MLEQGQGQGQGQGVEHQNQSLGLPLLRLISQKLLCGPHLLAPFQVL
jgi:hypothetical protein